MTQSRSTHWDRPELLRHLDGARALARSLLHSAAEAEDVSQDAATLAVRAGHVPGAWLYGAARNLAMQENRKAARRKRREREAARTERASDHGELMASIESHQRLVDHVLALNERDREVLLWRYFKDESVAQIARREGRTVAAVSNQLSRAHRSLERRLEADGGKERWMGGLALVAGKNSASASLAAGALFASASVKAVAASAALALCAGLLWYLGSGPGGSATPPPVVDAGKDDDPDRSVAGGDAPPVIESARVVQSEGRVPGASAAATAPTASLQGHIVESRGFPLEGARVSLRTPSGTSHAPRSSSGTGMSPIWDDLPIGVPLDVIFEADGTRWPDPIGTVTLDASGNPEATWTVHSRTIVRGIAVDEDGAPLPRQLVNLHGSWNPGASFAAEIEESSDMGTTLTDEAGRFVFPPVPPGKYQLMGRTQSSWVTANSEGTDGRIKSTEIEGRVTSQVPCTPWTQPLIIPVGAESMESTLQLFTKGKIHGQVVSGLTGEAVAGQAVIQINVVGTFDYTYGKTTEDGRFVSPPLPPGTFQLQAAGAPEGWVFGPAVEASPGDEGVVITVLPAAIVEVRVDTGPVPFKGKASLRAFALDAKSPVHIPQHWLNEGDAKARLAGLPPGSYAILFKTNDGSLAGMIPKIDLGPGELPGGLVIQAAEACKVTATSTDEMLFVTATIEGVRVDLCRVRPGQTYTMSLPAGPVKLAVQRGDEGTPVEQDVVIEGGETHHIR